ncbi:hypothetical protein I4F81_003980 [Pyropia yezoensis]|uniref:Uncharacterized protein n=1 Tax=Pyropia yezoensis TaxID=2788 RepID=A0ACC3BV96_PYRYE|nr:hypothetical protein I4F81_003980 [Neopyropia yezoensis]
MAGSTTISCTATPMCGARSLRATSGLSTAAPSPDVPSVRLCCHAGAALDKIFNLSQTVSLVELNLSNTSMDVHDLLVQTVPLSRQ